LIPFVESRRVGSAASARSTVDVHQLFAHADLFLRLLHPLLDVDMVAGKRCCMPDWGIKMFYFTPSLVGDV
jgi:hypothetical protein